MAKICFSMTAPNAGANAICHVAAVISLLERV
jgi:hypothetical protein